MSTLRRARVRAWRTASPRMGLSVAPDERAVGAGPFGHVGGEDRENMGRDADGSLARVGFGWRVEGLARLEQLDAAT